MTLPTHKDCWNPSRLGMTILYSNHSQIPVYGMIYSSPDAFSYHIRIPSLLVMNFHWFSLSDPCSLMDKKYLSVIWDRCCWCFSKLSEMCCTPHIWILVNHFRMSGIQDLTYNLCISLCADLWQEYQSDLIKNCS